MMRMVQTNAASICKRHTDFDFEDLVSEGLYALTLLLKRFDPDRGATLWTYATQRVRGAMLDHIKKERPHRARFCDIDHNDALMPGDSSSEEKHLEIRLVVEKISTDREKEVVVRHLRGETYQEIADKLDYSRDSARRDYARAVSEIRAKNEVATDIY